jgi:hypothetical protein
MADSVGKENDFISTFGKAVGDIFTNTAQSVGSYLPVWALNQLQDEQQDQLYNPVYNQQFQPRILPVFAGGTPQSAQVQQTGLLFDNIKIDGGTIVIGGIVLLGAILLLKS